MRSDGYVLISFMQWVATWCKRSWSSHWTKGMDKGLMSTNGYCCQQDNFGCAPLPAYVLRVYSGKARLAYCIILRLSAGSLMPPTCFFTTSCLPTLYTCWTVLAKLLTNMSGLLCLLKHSHISGKTKTTPEIHVTVLQLEKVLKWKPFQSLTMCCRITMPFLS